MFVLTKKIPILLLAGLSMGYTPCQGIIPLSKTTVGLGATLGAAALAAAAYTHFVIVPQKTFTVDDDGKLITDKSFIPLTRKVSNYIFCKLNRMLFNAIESGNIKIARLAIFLGADPNFQSFLTYDAYLTDLNDWPEWQHKAETFLMTAAILGNEGMVDLLIKNGADVTMQDEIQKRTVLHMAAWFGHITLVKKLIEEYNANPCLEDLYGYTAHGLLCQHVTAIYTAFIMPFLKTTDFETEMIEIDGQSFRLEKPKEEFKIENPVLENYLNNSMEILHYLKDKEVSWIQENQ